MDITRKRYFAEESWAHRTFLRMDWSLAGAAVCLAVLGVFFIYSAMSPSGYSAGFVTRQLAALTIGIIGMFFFMLIPYNVFQTYARGLYVVSVVALVLILIFGTRLRGSKSWFDFHFFYFQPVELTRLALAVWLAAIADVRHRDMRYWREALTPLFYTGIHLALILLQPDLSSALVLGPMVLAVLYVAGAPRALLLMVVATGAIALGNPLISTYFQIMGSRLPDHGLVSVLEKAFLQKTAFVQLWAGVCVLIALAWWFLRRWRIPVPVVSLVCALSVVIAGVVGSFVVEKALKQYQRKRLIAFVDPAIDPLGAGYNILQSEIAIGSGRFFGKGYLSGSQSQLGFLPEKHTDFIFSLVGEEKGFIGALCLIALYYWIVWRAFDISRSARDRFGRYLAVALGTFFAFSGFINIGMVMGMMPVTGLPLPFMSYGGSSMVGAFVAVGVLLSIHLRRYVL